MSLLNRLLLILILFSTVGCNAVSSFAEDQTEVIVGTSTEDIQAQNDNFRRTSRRLRQLESGIPASNITGILDISHGGTGQDFSAGTLGEYLYFSSTGVIGHTPLLHGSQFFSASGSFVAPAGVTRVYVTMQAPGGGGAGGRGGGAGTIAGGGSAGQTLRRLPYTVTPLSSYTVTINSAGTAGTGGTSGAGTNGTDAGTVVFDTITLTGGLKGTTTTAGTNTALSLNGGATNGVIGTYVVAGGNAGLGTFNVNGGAGGSSYFGLGGSGLGTNGGACSGYGSGGASGIDWNTNPGGNGSAGCPGFVLVEW